jgi:nitrogenase molybdenum-iron protein alpha/beta subunit
MKPGDIVRNKFTKEIFWITAIRTVPWGMHNIDRTIVNVAKLSSIRPEPNPYFAEIMELA